MVQGSDVTLRGACGKAPCACGQQRERHHLRYYLSRTEADPTHMLYIPRSRLKAFQQGVRGWRSDFKRLAQHLAGLNAQTLKSEKGKPR